jgi:Zn-dependent peptidase ImmA (M78 family)
LDEREFRAQVVGFIVDGSPEKAVALLAEYYGVSVPELRVGTVRRHRKVLACYVEKERRIYFSRSELLLQPFVVLHEFYHHLRASELQRSRQVEKRADLFANNFIREFKRLDPTLK